jgi:signal transduction histidine kinase
MTTHGSNTQRLGAVRTLITALMLCCLAGPLHAAEGEAHVLVLNGADPYLPVTLAIDKAIRANLSSEMDRRVAFFAESLDAQRFSQATLEPELVALFAKKYHELRIDVVVAVSEPALEFFEQHGEQLWPGARVVFAGFPVDDLEPSALPPGATGVLASFDVRGTIDIARRLQPRAHRIIVVSGTSEFDRRAEAQAQAVLSKADTPIPVEYLTGLPLPELVARVAAEPSDSIVIYVAQFRDRDGRPYTPREVLRAIAKTSGAPVYGPSETYLSFGAVAGSVESYATQGRLVAEQVRRALAGRPPDPSQIMLETPSGCVADERALRRWSLDPGRLPSGCEIRFADVPVWRQYWWQIVLVLAIIAAQASLLVALLAQRRQRRLAEQAEQGHRAALTRASRLALAGELTGAIAHEINQPLGAILSNADAGDLMLDSGTDQRDELRAILADIRRDDLRASEVIQRLRDLLGGQKLERKEFDLNEAVNDLESIMRAEAKRRSVTLDIRCAPESIAIMGDRIQIQQVLINLVLNAMDAVADLPEARRTIVVSVARGESGAVLSVRDRGQGIAPEHRAKVFESFFSTKRNGMGLGLSISRTIVEAHGGRIWVDRAANEGTLFGVELPLAIANGEPAPHPA